MRHVQSILRHILSIRTVSFLACSLLLSTAVLLNAQQATFAQRQDGSFGTLNLQSGVFAPLGSTGIEPAGMPGLGRNLYTIGYGNSTLYQVNPSNGMLTVIGSNSHTYYSFGGTTTGLYGVGFDKNLYAIDANSGAATLIGPTQLPDTDYQTLSSNGTTLYATALLGSDDALYTVNTSTGALTFIGHTGLHEISATAFFQGQLFAATETSQLYTLNLNNGTATFVNNTAQAIWGISGTAVPLQMVPVTPCRLVDTRNGNPIQGGTFQTFNLPQLASQLCANLLDTAAAYSLNVTLVPINHGRVRYLTLWPAGEDQPVVSTMNSFDGRTKANAAIVPAGTNGAVNVFVTDTTNVILDIDAYFASPTQSTLEFFPVTPCRVVDTRNSNFPTGLGPPHLSAGEQRDLPITMSPCIPSGLHPAGYSFNFTVVPYQQQPLHYLETWPTGNMPHNPVSTLNNLTVTNVANAAILPAGNGEEITVFVSDATELVVDINGYFAPPAQGGLSLYTLAPCRVIDTRNNHGQPFSGLLSPPVNVAGSPCGVPGGAQAYVFNATVVPSPAMGYLTLWPHGQQQPVVSTLNAGDGYTASNLAIVPNTDGMTNAYAGNGSGWLILDIFSYFGP